MEKQQFVIIFFINILSRWEGKLPVVQRGKEVLDCEICQSFIYAVLKSFRNYVQNSRSETSFGIE